MFLLLLALPLAATAAPPPVGALSAFSRSGQAFIVWDEVAGADVRYRVYRSASAITSIASLSPIGQVDQNTTLDARASSVEGGTHPYRVVPGVDLSLDSGLFVHTTAATGAFFYAVTTVDSTGENLAIVAGQNATASALAETLAVPAPVFQRTISPGNGRLYDIYTHWTSDVGTSLYPKMCVLPSKAFNFCVMRWGSAPSHPLVVRFHAFGGNYFGSQYGPFIGTGWPDEWALMPDDYVDNDVASTHWYGYHDGFNWPTGDPIPTSGTNVDYTLRRVEFELDWVLGNLPIDLTRVYAYGTSMGGAGATFVGHALADRFAARYAQVPKFDYSFLDEATQGNSFDQGGLQRDWADRRWGTVATDLPSSDGIPTFSRLSLPSLVQSSGGTDLPPLIAFCGRNDVTVGWSEKIGTFQAMPAAKQACMFFWDSRDHLGIVGDSLVEWQPSDSPQMLYNYRLDQSFPVFTQCSADDDPGTGDPTGADVYGTINGHVSWDRPPIDIPHFWEATIRQKALTNIYGTAVPPESIFVDVTPRRLQAFSVVPGGVHPWEVRDPSTNSVFMTGQATTDEDGLLTVPSVLVTEKGARVRIYEALTGIEGPAAGPDAATSAGVRAFPTPARGLPGFLFTLPRDAAIRVEILDLAGRRVARSATLSLPSGRHAISAADLSFSGTAPLAPGVYLYRIAGTGAESLGPTRSGRIVLVR